MSNKRPTIGIIVPNYNDGRFLTACLRSVLEQTDAPDELIVIDDGSTDHSREIIDSMLGDVPFARIYSNDRNCGATETSNRGLELATAEYLIFLSANDVIAPNLVKETRAFYFRHPYAGMCSALLNLIDEEGRDLGFFKSPMLSLKTAYLTAKRARKLLISIGTWTTGATVSYQRKLLVDIGGFDPVMKGFSDMLAPAIIAGRHGVGFIPKVLCSLRMHSGSVLASTLGDADGMQVLVRHFTEVAPKAAPDIFTAETMKRFLNRIYFAIFRTLPGPASPFISAGIGDQRANCLIMICRWLPDTAPKLRLLAGFLIIRGRDMPAFVWRRLILGWYWSIRNARATHQK